MEQLGFTDAIFINLETERTPQHIGFMGIYDPSTAPGGKVRFKDIIENTNNRALGLPVMTHVWDLGNSIAQIV